MMKHVATLALLLTTLAAPAVGDAVKVRSQARVEGSAVTLADVARLEGPYARQLGERIVARVPEGRDTMKLKLGELRRVLSAYDVNWGRLSLGGFTRCDIVRAEPTPEADVQLSGSTRPGGAPADADGPVAQSNVGPAVDLGTPTTLRQLVMKKLYDTTGAEAGQLVVEFRGGDDADAALNRSTFGGDYRITLRSDTGLGRAPMRIQRMEGQRVEETIRLTAEVKRRAMAVVATATVSKGRAFDRSNTTTREVLLSTDRGAPVAAADRVRGQVSAELLRAGAVIYPDHVAPPVLVERGELVTVEAEAGALVVRAVARATEDGAEGQKITLRHEKTRETFTATVTGRGQAGM